MNPWTGIFVVPKSGLWRLTFNAVANLKSGGSAWVELKTNGDIVARTYLNPQSVNDDTYHPLSINTIQKLEVGHTVTVEYGSTNSYGLGYGGHTTTAWTGMYLGSGIVSREFPRGLLPERVRA